MTHVLYLSYDGMTDPLGQSQVLPYIIGLSAQGYRFTLISFEKPERFAQHQKTIQDICNTHQIDWQPKIYHKSPPVFSTIWDIYQMYQTAQRLHQKKGFKALHCRGYISALVGLWMQKKVGVPFIFDMRGFWADEKRDAGAWPKGHFLYDRIYNFFKQKEKAFITESAHIISLTHRGKEEMMSWQLPISEDKIQVIPCCVDTQHFDRSKYHEADIQSFRNQLGIATDTFLWTYLGSIGTWYMLDEMLDFFKVWQAKHPNSKILFITHDEHDRIGKAAEVRQISDSVIIRGATRAEVPLSVVASQASIFFIRPTYSKMSSSPTKQGEIMSLGIPIVCNAGVGDTDQIVLNYQSGALIQSFDNNSYQSIADTFQPQHFNPETLRAGAIDYFELKKGVENYLKVYQKVLKNGIQ